MDQQLLALVNQIPQLAPFLQGIFTTEMARSIIAQLIVNSVPALFAKLKKDVPDDKIIVPQASVFVPSLEGYALNYDNQTIQQMFYHLLEFSIHKEKSSSVHPAYPILLRQISSDEAKMLALLHKKAYKAEFIHHFDLKRFGISHVEEVFDELKDEFKRLGLQSDMSQCFSHLMILGLTTKEPYENWIPNNDGNNNPKSLQKSNYNLTDLGRNMMDVCCK